MSCQILNCLGVNRSVNQIGDIGVSELMGSYVGIYRVDNIVVVFRSPTQRCLYCVSDTLTVYILVVCPVHGGSDIDILPKPFELGIGQWIAFTVRNHKVRVTGCFDLFQTVHKTFRDGNISLCGISL